jgi:hypothetical protein
MPQKNLVKERTEAILDYLTEHPTAGRLVLSRALGIPLAPVQRILQALKIKQPTPSGEDTAAPENLPKEGVRRDDVANTVEMVTANPCTLEDLLKACKVDLTRWKVGRHVVNKWEVGVRQDNGTVSRTPLFQIKAYLEPVAGLADADVIRDTIAWIRAQTVVPVAPAKCDHRALGVEDETLLELSIPDIHFGKLAWHAETGKDYDNEIAASLYMQATRALWAKASVFPVGRILLVVGNDFFNVNGAANATALGTPQSEDGRWPKTFRRGIALLKEQVEFLRGKAPGGVDVVVIRGNHDAERMYMAGEVLAAMYAECKDVSVTNEPIKRQYIQWGTVLLGLTHGDKIKLDKLPLLMAGEAPQMWASTTHREWHIGHYHHKKETQYHTGQEHNSVRVRVLPSLTTADEWHYENGYVGAKQAAEAYLWAKKAGYVGHLSWSPVE